MNRKLLMLTLIPLALGMIITNVSASAERWYHDVGKDSSSQTQTYIYPLPPFMYPFTQQKMISTVTQDSHWVYNTVFDGSQNLHVKMEYTSKGSVQDDVWWWNTETQEWIYCGGWSQKFSNIYERNELVVDSFTEIQTSKQLNIGHETFKIDMINPLTGDTIVQGYSVMRYMIVKYVNGELQFQNKWEIRRDF